MPTGTCGKPYSPLSLVWVSRLTPVASWVAVTFTLASTAPLASATRPRMRPPVLWADVSVEQIRHRLRTSQQDFRDDFGIGMEHILQISGTILLRPESAVRIQESEFNHPNQLVRNGNLAIIVQG